MLPGERSVSALFWRLPSGWESLEPLSRKRYPLAPAEWRAIRRLTRCIRRLKSRRLNDSALARTDKLPIRFAIHLVHSRRRVLFYRELSLFAVFVFTLLVLLLLRSPEIHECWETTEVLTEAFDLQTDGLDANSPFNEVKSPAQWFAWLREDWANSVFGHDPRFGVLGELQLRVVRELPSKHALHVDDGVYKLDRRDYSHGWESGGAPETGGLSFEQLCGGADASGTPTHLLGTNLCFKHEDSFSFLRNNWLKPMGYDDYGHGGYSKLLSTTNRTAFERAVDVLEAGAFVDARVVAVALTLNILNTRSNLLSVVRVLFEFSRTGNVMNSAMIASVRGRALDLDSWNGVTELLLEALLYAMVTYYALVMLADWWRVGRRWLYDKFNACELVIALSFGAFLIGYLRFLRAHSRILAARSWVAHDIADVALVSHMLMTMMAWTLLLCIFKMFKYLRLDKSMMLIFDVISSASADLASFLIIFIMLLVGFSMVGHFAFGPLVAGFHSPMESMVTCMRFIVGDVEVEPLRRANPVLAPIFFFTYSIGAVLVLINVFIAIINEYYTEVKARDRGLEGDFDAMPFAMQQRVLGRVSRGLSFSGLFGAKLWSLLVRARLAVARVRVHEGQPEVLLSARQAVFVYGPSERLARETGESSESVRDEMRSAGGGGEAVAQLSLTHDLSFWVKEADRLRVGGLVLRVDAVKAAGCLCQVQPPRQGAHAAPSSALLRAGARVRVTEYHSEQDETVLIGLLAMVRWRLIELDRRGEQFVSTQQLLEMSVACMLSAPSRSLYTPVHFLNQHASEQREKREACRAMAARCARGETTELDRLNVRALLLPSIISIMDKFGFDDSATAAGGARRPPGLVQTARGVRAVRAFASVGDELRATAALAAECAHDAPAAALVAAQQPPPQQWQPQQQQDHRLLKIETKLDALLDGLAQTRAETRELRQQLERMVGAVAQAPAGAVRAPLDLRRHTSETETWADAFDDGPYAQR